MNSVSEQCQQIQAATTMVLQAEKKPALPLEVCERVIDFADGYMGKAFDHDTGSSPSWDRYHVLRALCLTHKDWHPRARLYLFHSVRLRLSPQFSKSNFPAFINGLNSRPQNGELVRELAIYTQGPSSQLSLAAQTLPRRLPNLELIFFRSTFENVHPKFNTSLYQFRSVHTLQLTDVGIRTYGQLHRVISSFRNLKHLSIQWEGVSNIQNPAVPMSEARKITVSSLDLAISPVVFTSIIEWFRPDPEGFTLKMNIYGFRRVAITALCEFLKQSGKTLQEFVLRTELQMHTPLTTLLDFSSSTNLRVLDVAFFSIRHKYFAQDISALGNVLSSITSPHLDQLFIQSYFWGSRIESTDEPRLAYQPMPSLGWDAIDFATTSPIFDSCTSIRFGMFRTTTKGFEAVEQEEIAELLPRLASRPTADLRRFYQQVIIRDIDTEYEENNL